MRASDRYIRVVTRLAVLFVDPEDSWPPPWSLGRGTRRLSGYLKRRRYNNLRALGIAGERLAKLMSMDRSYTSEEYEDEHL